MIKYCDFEVLQDQRENYPWSFEIEEKEQGKFTCTGTTVKQLKTGDYTIKGFEHKLSIEKKSGIYEIANNFLTKKTRERFIREMERMKDIDYKYILIEGNIDKDKLKLGIPKSKYGPPMSVVVKWLMQISIKYNVHVMFVGDCGPKIARYIMEEFLKNEFAEVN